MADQQQSSNGNGRHAWHLALTIAVPILITSAGALVSVGYSQSDARNNDRRIEKLEDWRDTAQKNQQDRDMRTAERLSQIETKIDWLLRGLGVASPPGAAHPGMPHPGAAPPGQGR